MNGFTVFEVKIYFYDRRKINTWRKKNKDKVMGRGNYSEDGYYYIYLVKLSKGEVLEFPDTALNLVEIKLVDILLTEIKRKEC